mgnify:CR=1 FL=1
MVLMDMADNATNRIQLRWNVPELTPVVNVELPGTIVLTDVNAMAIDEEPGIAAVDKILLQTEDGGFVFVGFPPPRTELGAVSAFIAVRIKVQRLIAILKARYRHREVGAVRAHVDALAADVVALQTATDLLGNKGVAIVFIDAIDGDKTFALIDIGGVDIVPGLIAVMAGDIFPRQNDIRGAPGVADSRDDRRGAALHVANQEDASLQIGRVSGRVRG